MSADGNTCERSRAIMLVFSSKRPSVRLQWQFEACNGPTHHNHKMPLRHRDHVNVEQQAH